MIELTNGESQTVDFNWRLVMSVCDQAVSRTNSDNDDCVERYTTDSNVERTFY